MKLNSALLSHIGLAVAATASAYKEDASAAAIFNPIDALGNDSVYLRGGSLPVGETRRAQASSGSGPLTVPKTGSPFFEIIQLGSYPDPDSNYINSDSASIQAKSIRDQTYVEVTFSGQNVAAWGADLALPVGACLQVELITNSGVSTEIDQCDGATFWGFVLEDDTAEKMVFRDLTDAATGIDFQISNILGAVTGAAVPTLPPASKYILFLAVAALVISTKAHD